MPLPFLGAPSSIGPQFVTGLCILLVALVGSAVAGQHAKADSAAAEAAEAVKLEAARSEPLAALVAEAKGLIEQARAVEAERARVAAEEAEEAEKLYRGEKL
jgi:hypothetical protein